MEKIKICSKSCIRNMQDVQASSRAESCFKASWFLFPWPLPGDLALLFPRKALVMGYSRLSRSRQEFVHGSGSVVLLPVDAASHNSSINISDFLGQEA